MFWHFHTRGEDARVRVRVWVFVGAVQRKRAPFVDVDSSAGCRPGCLNWAVFVHTSALVSAQRKPWDRDLLEFRVPAINTPVVLESQRIPIPV